MLIIGEDILSYVKDFLASNFLALILLVVLLVGNFNWLRNRTKQNNIIVFWIGYSLLAVLFESIGVFIDGRDGEVYLVLQYIFGFLNYLTIAGAGFILVCFLNTHFFGQIKKRVYIFGLIPLLVIFGLDIVNFFYPLLFKINSENDYVRLNGYYISLAIDASYLIYAFCLYLYALRNGKASRYFPLYLFFIPVCLGVAFQSVFYGISLVWPCIAIGLCGMVSCIKSERIYRDELTGLYSRAFFNYLVRKAQKEKRPCLSGIMLDINNFKKINDRFGHDFGDKALVDFAIELKKCSPADSVVIRFSGDEFVILIRTDDMDEIRRAMNSINEGFAAFNDSRNDRPYELFASMGYATYKKDESPEDFLRDFDQKMYKEKERYHNLNTNEK